jgi:hypothetical protein
MTAQRKTTVMTPTSAKRVTVITVMKPATAKRERERTVMTPTSSHCICCVDYSYVSRASGFGFRVSGFGSRVSGFGESLYFERRCDEVMTE